MYAALKGSFLEAVLYRGTVNGEVYPPWFVSDVIEGRQWRDDSGRIFYILSDETDDQFEYVELVPGVTMAIKNRFNEIYFSTIDAIMDAYLPVGPNMIAAPADTVEFFVFKQDDFKNGIPNWVYGLISFGIISINADPRATVFFDEDKQSYVSLYPSGILIRNKNGSVRCLSQEMFNKYFDAGYPYYY